MPENDIKIKPDSPETYTALVERFDSNLRDMLGRVRGGITNLSDFTFMFSLNNAPMSMDRFFMFLDLFEVMPFSRLLYKTARQVAKTTSASVADLLQRLTRQNTNSLTVTPLFGQAKRISTDIAGPLLRNSLFRDEILHDKNASTILRRRILGGGTQHYSYALLDAMRIRSLNSIDHLWVDEVQDVRASVLPVIEQVQAGRPYTRWRWYTGTPLSMGNLIQILWERSSQAEQAIKCEHCAGNHQHHGWNVGSMDQQLWDMIGPKGPVCAYCGADLDVFAQVMVPRYPEREEIFAGRHISQVLHPLHACIPSQWRLLLENRRDYTEAQFANEVLGESFDSADRMIDLTSLKNACVLGENTMKYAMDHKNKLAITAMGVDWGGGGDTDSYTKIVLGGIRHGTSAVEVHYMCALPQSLPPQAQVAEVLRIYNRYGPSIFTHDYTAMGWVFEGLGLQARINSGVLWPFTYGFSPSRDVLYVTEATEGSRSSMHLDHTRSLFALYTMIKSGRVRFPDYDKQMDPNTGYRPVDDFLTMFSERKPTAHAGDILYIKKDPGASDDFVHATNFLATACWYRAGSYPSIPGMFKDTRLQHTEQELQEMNGEWILPDENGGTYVA